MSISNKFFGALLLLVPAASAHYWCTVNMDIKFSDNAPCPASSFEIFYLPDSLYNFDAVCGKITKDFNGHCDLGNTVTYWSKGYYQKSIKIQDHCKRQTFGTKPPPEPIAQVDCPVTLDPGPTADAGRDHNVRIFTFDTLNGTASKTYANKPFTRYHWRSRFNATDNSNPGEIVLLDSTTARPRFVPIVAGDYRFYLAVEDANGRSAWDTVKVHVCTQSEPCITAVKPQNRFFRNSIKVQSRNQNGWTLIVPVDAVSIILLDAKGKFLADLKPVKGRALWQHGGRGKAMALYGLVRRKNGLTDFYSLDKK